MTESVLHELVLIGLNIGGNVLVWHYFGPERKWIGLLLLVATIVSVFLLARRWQIDLTYV
ncbi:hypothetical protein MGMO_29c00160 [Methyloglobulus morosus KoM1]|uniref:Uncharacterized protein n=1 Tax=Methyloglobulus morosus KoM1 TaxID=1116472 RepID=V5BIV7_9GAMM|nr:hypothetical protein [Methyloglobulus morosus]ESS73245.1 hypothetical protein MGMO_29c00160 [Methyloglobulus morosus KoM1]